MKNQNLIIYQFSSLYQILKELELNLNFKITEVLTEKKLNLETENLNNYIIITKKKNFKYSRTIYFRQITN